MSRIVFDIETVGVDFEALSQDAQDYILKDAEDEKKTQEKKTKLGLWPFTGEIAAICVLNPDTQRGHVFFQAPGQKIKPLIKEGISYEIMTEKETLEAFWREIRDAEQFITFNGRNFDCPYIMLRSGVLKVRPTKNLLPYRFSTEEHIDLLEQLTFYGAFRRFSLDFYCKSFGLEKSKLAGMSGEKVQEYFKNGQYLDIARYCAADVMATAELYERWEKYIKS